MATATLSPTTTKSNKRDDCFRKVRLLIFGIIESKKQAMH